MSSLHAGWREGAKAIATSALSIASYAVGCSSETSQQGFLVQLL